MEKTIKDVLLEYVGDKLNPEDDKVSTEMIVEVVSKEFPEFLLLVAEENYLRGYNQALSDQEEYKKELLIPVEQLIDKTKNVKKYSELAELAEENIMVFKNE